MRLRSDRLWHPDPTDKTHAFVWLIGHKCRNTLSYKNSIRPPQMALHTK